MIIGFIIWSFVALIFFAIGLSSRKSKEPVGFFTFIKPPIVKDVIGYNRSVSKLWIVSSIVLEMIGVPFLFIEQNSPIFLIVVLGVVAWLIGLITAYIKIEAKYKK